MTFGGRRLPQTKAEARRWLAGQRREARVESWRWKLLMNEVGESLERELANPEDAQAVLEELRRQDRRITTAVKAAAGKKPTPRRTLERAEGLIPETDLVRSRALWDYVGREAASIPAVQGFRQEFLEGAPLDRERAEAWAQSIALRFCGVDFFKQKGIPLRDHRSYLGPRDEEGRLVHASWDENARFVIEWPGGRTEEPYTWEMFKTESDRQASKVYLPSHAGKRGLSVYVGSVMSELAITADALAFRLPFRRWEASWFVLTDEVLGRDPIEGRIEGATYARLEHRRIELSIEPWVSPATVTRAFRTMQEEHLGGRARPISEPHLKLFEFADALIHREGALPWKALMERWNASGAKRRYHSFRHFKRDYERTAASVRFPRSGQRGRKR